MGAKQTDKTTSKQLKTKKKMKETELKAHLNDMHPLSPDKV